MNSKNKLTITLTKIQRQTLKLPVRLRCPACHAEFEMRAAMPAGAINHEDPVTELSPKTK